MANSEGFIVQICNRRATDVKGQFVLFVQVILVCSYYSNTQALRRRHTG